MNLYAQDMPSIAGTEDYSQVHPLHQEEGSRYSLDGVVEVPYHTLGPARAVAAVAAAVPTATMQVC